MLVIVGGSTGLQGALSKKPTYHIAVMAPAPAGLRAALERAAKPFDDSNIRLRVVASPAVGRKALETKQADALLLLSQDRLVFRMNIDAKAAAIADTAVRALRNHLPPAPELTVATLHPLDEKTTDAEILVAAGGALLLLTSLAFYGQWLVNALAVERQDCRRLRVVDDDHVVRLLEQGGVSLARRGEGCPLGLGQAPLGTLEAVVDRLRDREEALVARDHLPLGDEAQVVQDWDHRAQQLGHTPAVGGGVQVEDAQAAQFVRQLAKPVEDRVGGDASVGFERPLADVDGLQHSLPPGVCFAPSRCTSSRTHAHEPTVTRRREQGIAGRRSLHPAMCGRHSLALSLHLRSSRVSKPGNPPCGRAGR
jgi:hypothetical protein